MANKKSQDNIFASPLSEIVDFVFDEKVVDVFPGIIFLVILPFALLDLGVAEADLVQYIVANSLFGVFFASLTGNIAHITFRSFHLKESSLVGIAGSIAAMLVLSYIVVQPWYSRGIFNVVIILFLLYVLIAQLLYPSTARKKKKISRNKSFQLAVAGVAGGALSAASGTGGGAVTVPLLNHWLGINIKMAKSISLGMILLSSMIMTIANLLACGTVKYSVWQQGLVLFPIVLPLTIGVLIGAPMGVKVSHIVSSNRLSSIFAILLIVVIIEKLVEIIQLLS